MLYKICMRNIFSHKSFQFVKSAIRCCSSSRTVPLPIQDHAVASDKDIGVTAFLSKHQGFSGILRHNYYDFLVNEVSNDKEVVRLTNLGLCENVTSHFFKITQLLTKEQSDKLIGALEGNINEEKEINVSVLTESDMNDLCQTLRRLLLQAEVYLKNTDLGHVLVLSPRVEGKDFYSNFVLNKQNIATQDALEIIARILKIKLRDLSTAGMKDKRSVSSQRVSARNVTAEKLLEMNNKLRNMKVGSIYYDSNALNFGDIYGNHFTILVRDICTDISNVECALQNFASKGFINYYGLQRFGKTRQSILAIGKALLSRNWQCAVEMILKPNDHKSSEDVLKCRQVWWDTRDAEKAFKCLSFKSGRTALLLRGLIENNNDFEKALEWVPKTVIKLSLHSYCSYIWNRIVSRRMCEFGTTPMVGDTVVLGDTCRLKRENNDRVEVLGEDMLDKGIVSMYNVVLPLPAYDMKVPKNIVGTWYSELLEEDGLNVDSFKSDNPRYCVGAQYRHILTKPENVLWSLLKYDDPSEDLLKNALPAESGSTEHAGSKMALKMEFTLQSASYATCALREIMQTSITELS